MDMKRKMSKWTEYYDCEHLSSANILLPILEDTTTPKYLEIIFTYVEKMKRRTIQ